MCVPDSPAECTIIERDACYNTHADAIRQDVRKKCSCPVPCHFNIFDPTISYSTTSIFAIDHFLANTNRSSLKSRYQKARDVTHRLQKDKADVLRSLAETLDASLQVLSDVIQDLNTTTMEYKENLMRISTSFLWNWNETNVYFQYQNHILQKNLVRARDAMSERTFSVLGHAVQEFSFSVEAKIRKLADPGVSAPAVRQVLFLSIRTQLNARLDIAKRTLQNYTQLITSFLNATSIFNYRFMNFARKYSNYILPRELLLEAFTRSAYVRKRALRVENDIINMAKWMKTYGEIANEAYYIHTLNDTALHLTTVFFLRSSRFFLQSKSLLFNDFIQWPVIQLDKREKEFLQMRTKFVHLVDVAVGYMASLSDTIDRIKNSLLKHVKGGIAMCTEYLMYGNVSKLVVAEYFVSKEIQRSVSDMKMFFETIRSRGQRMHENWDQLTDVTLHMWNYTLSQTNLKRYWTLKNIHRYLRNYTDVAADIIEEYAQNRDLIDIRCKFHNKDEDFLRRLASLTEHMMEFYDGSHVDVTFVRNNFLKLDLFYRELNYEKITQQIAYDMFALLCDIGGSMGLFIGASVMTVFELLDLTINSAVTGSTSRS